MCNEFYQLENIVRGICGILLYIISGYFFSGLFIRVFQAYVATVTQSVNAFANAVQDIVPMIIAMALANNYYPIASGLANIFKNALGASDCIYQAGNVVAITSAWAIVINTVIAVAWALVIVFMVIALASNGLSSQFGFLTGNVNMVGNSIQRTVLIIFGAILTLLSGYIAKAIIVGL